MPSALRRRLLKVAGAFFLGQAFVPGPALAAVSSKAERIAGAAFLDVLLPRDALSGSATDLAVDQALWRLARDNVQLQRLLRLGTQWLDMTGGPPFAQLEAAQKIAVVEWMAGSDWDQVPRRFYELTRQLAIEIYYSQPAAWAGLPLERPPQPLGYPPPWQ